jgi:hypothetical protein
LIIVVALREEVTSVGLAKVIVTVPEKPFRSEMIIVEFPVSWVKTGPMLEGLGVIEKSRTAMRIWPVECVSVPLVPVTVTE